MTDTDPQAVRERIEECRQDLARAEGEAETLKGEASDAVAKLRELLVCKPGKERAALRKLREKIEAGETEVEELLDQAEVIRDGTDEEEEEEGD